MNPSSNSPDLDAKRAFLASLERLVKDEFRAEWRHLHAIWEKPLPERVASGYCVEALEISKVLSNGDLQLHCTINRSRFREGDLLCLSQGDPRLQPATLVTLELDEDTDLVVSPSDERVPMEEIARQRDGWTLDVGMLDLSAFYLDAINQLGETTAGRERILPFLMGKLTPKIDQARLERGLSIGEAAGLDWAQTEALAHAYATDSAYLIQGPPGTGKTRVLARLAEALVEDGERVLVTAFTHRAINNALNAINQVAPLTPAAKIGEPSRADDLEVENYLSFGGSPMSSMGGGYAIGATPFATRTKRLDGVEFDTVIFDEASQITVPLAVMGMLPARKFIFIGDHQQLPPVLQSVSPTEAAHKSIFGHLVGRGFDTLLETTYRLSNDLARWPSRQFYGGRVRPADGVGDRVLALNSAPSRFKDVLEPKRVKVFIDLGHRNTRTRSRAEASVIADLIKEAVQCGVEPREIGVVTPYRAQAREIRNLLRLGEGGRELVSKVVVDTVERMQGQERDFIIISLTTSDVGFAANLADFLFQPQRLNVAVTRPRRKLVIVGSRHLLGIEVENPDVETGVALMEELLQDCDSVYLSPDKRA